MNCSAEKTSQFHQEIIQITRISAGFNIFLSIIKCVLGFTTGSLAIFSDGIHSFSDLLSDIIVYIGIRIGSKPPDKNHHYGHASYEILAEILVALLLLVAAVKIIKTGLSSISENKGMVFSWLVFLTAIISVVIKEGLFRWTLKKSKELNSEVLLINAWHHRSDAYSSVTVVIGSLFLLNNYKFADAYAGIIVGGMLIFVALKFLLSCFADLTDSSPGKEIEDIVKEIIEDFAGIEDFHQLRIRKVASSIYLDVHIKVDPEFKVIEAHDIATGLEKKIKSSLPGNIFILTHIEPFNK